MQMTQYQLDGVTFRFHNPNDARRTEALLSRFYAALFKRLPDSAVPRE